MSIATVCPPAFSAADKVATLEKQLTAARDAFENERYVSAEKMLRKVVGSADKMAADFPSDVTAGSSSGSSTAVCTGGESPVAGTSGASPAGASGASLAGASGASVAGASGASVAGTSGTPAPSTNSAPDTTGSTTGSTNASKENGSQITGSAPADSPSLRVAKVADEAYLCLGNCCEKLQKFSDAETAYKKALELEATRALPEQARTRLTGLDEVYRTVKIDQLGERANDVAKQAGIKNVFAVRKDGSENINVELGTRYKKRIDEDTANSAAPASTTGATGTKNPDSNKLKEIRIDPKLSFQLSKQPNGIKLSNIEGLFVDVGLWVKLMEVELLQTNEGPKARVTGGKFGVQKTVDVGVPDQVYKQVRSSIEKLDPFFEMVNSIVGGGSSSGPSTAPQP